MKGIWFQRPVLGWAAYDWANSAFSLSVVTAFVPVLLSEYWNEGADSTVTTFRLGMANGVASLLIAATAPLLGAIADLAGRRKALLFLFAGLGIVMTGSLYFVAAGQWLLGVVCYVFASVGFASSNSLYDGLMVHVAPASHYDRVSAYGYALGYLGGALLFSVNVVMVANPNLFGLASEVEAIRIAFLMVAVWWFVFSMPLLFWVKESGDNRVGKPLSESFRQLITTIKVIVRQPDVMTFLVAYWLYIDGVFTIIKMAVDYGLSQGLSMQDLILAILITNFVGFPAALAFGRIGLQIGAKSGLVIALVIYIIVTFAAAFITTAAEFFVLAICIGLVQGGVQSLSRSFFARLIPRRQSAEYFGFFNMIGKFSAVLGPILTGVVALSFGSQRIGILSILILFLAGLFFLLKVQQPSTEGEA
ncbi:MAG: MFS transporter [Gammaproteobacteria bacterium]|nr:MFS transporter [Gammaproteobacteria bacterium]